MDCYFDYFIIIYEKFNILWCNQATLLVSIISNVISDINKKLNGLIIKKNLNKRKSLLNAKMEYYTL